MALSDSSPKTALASDLFHDLLQTQIHTLLVEQLRLERTIRITHHDARPLPAGTFAGLANIADANSLIAPSGSGLLSLGLSRSNSPAAIAGTTPEDVNDANDKNTRVEYMTSGPNGTRDIYGNEGLKQADANRYFACSNCARKVAGSRFAAHIDRCLGGRQARARN